MIPLEMEGHFIRVDGKIKEDALIWRKATLTRSLRYGVDSLCDLLPDFEMRNPESPICIVTQNAFHKWLRMYFKSETQKKLSSFYKKTDIIHPLNDFKVFFLGAIAYYGVDTRVCQELHDSFHNHFMI